MGDTWVITDSHFGHKLAAQERGFETAEEHDRALMRTLRKRFREHSTVWWVGDVAFDGWRLRIPQTVGTLPGTHHLIAGNHDRVHPLNSRAQDYHKDFLAAGFASINLAGRISHAGINALLSHFPYSGDNGDRGDRYAEWRLVDAGIPLIHGHTHGKEILTYTDKGTPQVHAGLDAWGLCPVPIHDLIEILRKA